MHADFSGVYGFDVQTTSLAFLPGRYIISCPLRHANRDSRRRCSLHQSRRPLLGYDLRQSQETQQAMALRCRTPSPPYLLSRRRPPHSQLVLACLDLPISSPLGSAHRLWRSVRFRLPDHLRLAVDVRDRCLQNILRQRARQLGHPAQCSWGAVAAGCQADVRDVGGELGDLAGWISESSMCTHSVCALVQRGVGEREE